MATAAAFVALNLLFTAFVQPAIIPPKVYVCARADDGTQFCRYEKDVGQGKELRTATR